MLRSMLLRFVLWRGAWRNAKISRSAERDITRGHNGGARERPELAPKVVWSFFILCAILIERLTAL